MFTLEARHNFVIPHQNANREHTVTATRAYGDTSSIQPTVLPEGYNPVHQVHGFLVPPSELSTASQIDFDLDQTTEHNSVYWRPQVPV